MRVLIVSKALISRVYRQKLSALARLGVEVVAVVPPSWREGGAEQRLEPSDAGDYVLRTTPMAWNGHFHVHYYPDLAAIIREVNPDLVHMDEEPYNLATWLGVRAARGAGIPATFFSWQNLRRWYPPPFSWMERSVYRLCRGVLAGSDAVVNVLRSKGYGGAITVVPQFGVDTSVFHPRPRPDEAFTVGLFNRLIPAKAPLECIEAFAALPDTARLVVVGDGPMRGDVADAVTRLGLSERASLHPRVPSSDMPDLMSSVDTVLLFSRTTRSWTEQFGRVLIEGMASGAVVVGSDSGEIPWVIGDAGVVVPEGDVPALSGALRSLEGDKELRERLAQAGLARVQNRFTNERIAQLTVAGYESAIG